MSTYAFHFYCRGDAYRHSVGQKGVCSEPGGVLSLRLFAGPLDFPSGCGGDLSLPAGIKRMDVLRALGGSILVCLLLLVPFIRVAATSKNGKT